MEKNGFALEDANKALEISEGSTKAIASKAEALYNSGDFEQALVWFERGTKLCNENVMSEGRLKCQQAILTSIGEEGIVFELDLVNVAILETMKIKEKKEKKSKEKWIKIR